MNEAVWRFARDLSDAGIAPRRRAVLALLYDRALAAASGASWARLYRTLFSALRLVSYESPASVVPAAAVESLLRIVEDDFGLSLFGERAVSRLRASLASAFLSRGSVFAVVQHDHVAVGRLDDRPVADVLFAELAQNRYIL